MSHVASDRMSLCMFFFFFFSVFLLPPPAHRSCRHGPTNTGLQPSSALTPCDLCPQDSKRAQPSSGLGTRCFMFVAPIPCATALCGWLRPSLFVSTSFRDSCLGRRGTPSTARAGGRIAARCMFALSRQQCRVVAAKDRLRGKGNQGDGVGNRVRPRERWGEGGGTPLIQTVSHVSKGVGSCPDINQADCRSTKPLCQPGGELRHGRQRGHGKLLWSAGVETSLRLTGRIKKETKGHRRRVDVKKGGGGSNVCTGSSSTPST